MDLYTVLGLTEAATTAEIKRAYRRLARRFHPDINPGDGTAALRFRQIAEAYETLSDPTRRHRYDERGFVATSVDESSFEFAGFDFSGTGPGVGATFGELFAGAGWPSPERAPQRGADLHLQIALDFEDSIRGAERRVSVNRQSVCEACEGRGLVPTRTMRCGDCGGAGSIRSARGHMVFARPCPGCEGTGVRRFRPCDMCHGDGVESRVEGVRCRFPPGIQDGARIRVPGKGHSGRYGAESGDLYITVAIRPHPHFRREGDDLHLEVPVSIAEAALGARIEVPSLEGPVRVRVPPGTQSGQRFRLRDRGAPLARDARRGDLVVQVRLLLPRMLDERSKELLREFGQINGEDVRAGFWKT